MIDSGYGHLIFRRRAQPGNSLWAHLSSGQSVLFFSGFQNQMFTFFLIVSMLAVEGAFHAGPGLQSCGLSRCISFIFPSHCLIPERLPDGVVTFMFSQCWLPGDSSYISRTWLGSLALGTCLRSIIHAVYSACSGTLWGETRPLGEQAV